MIRPRSSGRKQSSMELLTLESLHEIWHCILVFQIASLDMMWSLWNKPDTLFFLEINQVLLAMLTVYLLVLWVVYTTKMGIYLS